MTDEKAQLIVFVALVTHLEVKRNHFLTFSKISNNLTASHDTCNVRSANTCICVDYDGDNRRTNQSLYMYSLHLGAG